MEKHRTMLEKRLRVLTLNEAHKTDNDVIPIAGAILSKLEKK